MSDGAGSSRRTTQLLGSPMEDGATTPTTRLSEGPIARGPDTPAASDAAVADGSQDHTEVLPHPQGGGGVSKSRVTVGVAHPRSAFSSQQGKRVFQTLGPSARPAAQETAQTAPFAAVGGATGHNAENGSVRGRHTLDPSHPQTAFGSQQGQRAFRTLGPDRNPGEARPDGARDAAVGAATSRATGSVASGGAPPMSALFDPPPPPSRPSRSVAVDDEIPRRPAPNEATPPRSLILSAAVAIALLSVVAGTSYWLGARSVSRSLRTETRANLRAGDPQRAITPAPPPAALAIPSAIATPEAAPARTDQTAAPTADDTPRTDEGPATQTSIATGRSPEAHSPHHHGLRPRRTRAPRGPITQTPF